MSEGPSRKTDRLLAVKRSYACKPPLRRETTLESMLGASFAGMLAVFFVVRQLAHFTSSEATQRTLVLIAAVAAAACAAVVLLVCIATLTGPVYTRRLNFTTGELETWGASEKFAATVISAVILIGTVWLGRIIANAPVPDAVDAHNQPNVNNASGSHPIKSSSIQAAPTMRIVYLKKANDDLISHCSCGDGRVTFPAQMDCPWCGCGWLFTCITCRKAFAFAEGVELKTTWEELAKEDIAGKGLETSEEIVASWLQVMQALLADVEPGERYVILDGAIIPAEAAGAEFDGWHAHHDFDSLPHIDALTDRSVIDRVLANRDYWTQNALPDEE